MGTGWQILFPVDDGESLVVAVGDGAWYKPVSGILKLPLSTKSKWIKGPDFSEDHHATTHHGSRSVVTNDGKTLLVVGGMGIDDFNPTRKEMLRKFWCSTVKKCYWTVFEKEPLKLRRYNVMAFMAPSWLQEFIKCR